MIKFRPRDTCSEQEEVVWEKEDEKTLPTRRGMTGGGGGVRAPSGGAGRPACGGGGRDSHCPAHTHVPGSAVHRGGGYPTCPSTDERTGKMHHVPITSYYPAVRRNDVRCTLRRGRTSKTPAECGGVRRTTSHGPPHTRSLGGQILRDGGCGRGYRGRGAGGGVGSHPLTAQRFYWGR